MPVRNCRFKRHPRVADIVSGVTGICYAVRDDGEVLSGVHRCGAWFLGNRVLMLSDTRASDAFSGRHATHSGFWYYKGATSPPSWEREVRQR